MGQKLPIGIQDFASIREVGKPLPTLGPLFEERRQFFGPIAGKPPLAVDSLERGWKRHPVIRIDLNAGDYAEGAGIFKAALRNKEIIADHANNRR
ncbi:MAG: hypothetical protein LBG07_06675 [Treponema sp.]|jgi:hypothetical protein|nr:hypothetical protein [Treponema sp.]